MCIAKNHAAITRTRAKWPLPPPQNITALYSWARSGARLPILLNMVNELHQGIIGRLYYAKGWYANHRPSIGIGKVVPVPDNLNYELWQGYAPRKAYKDNLIHYNWHWHWNWGTGEALNNGTHEIDVMRWALGVDYPTKVTSSGGRFAFKDDWETPDTQVIIGQFSIIIPRYRGKAQL